LCLKQGVFKTKITLLAKKRRRKIGHILISSFFRKATNIAFIRNFLKSKLQKGLERLNLSTLDCFLLLNPETYLSWAKLKKQNQQDARNEFNERIRKAFTHLEKEIENGRIRCYGVSSNSLCLNTKEYEFVSLESLWQIAESISTRHHFQVVQFPFNLFENSGIRESNLSGNNSTIAFARMKGLGVMVNRPFDTFIRNSFVRLVDIQLNESALNVNEKELVRRIDDTIRETADIEDYIIEEILPALNTDKAEKKAIKKKLSLSVLLEKYWKKMSSCAYIQELQSTFFDKALESISKDLLAVSQDPDYNQRWLQRYEEVIRLTFNSLNDYYLPRDYRRIQTIRQQLNNTYYGLDQKQTLSQVIVSLLRSTEGMPSRYDTYAAIG